MARFSDPLSRVRVASPCTADWDSMIGNDRTVLVHQRIKVFYIGLNIHQHAFEELVSSGSFNHMFSHLLREKAGKHGKE